MFAKSNKDTSLQSKLLDYSFNTQKMIGLYPHQNKYYMLGASFILVTHFIGMGLAVYMMCSNFNDLETLLIGFNTFIAHIQALTKYTAFFLHRKEMRKLIDDLPKFWRIKNADNYKLWIKVVQVHFVLVAIAICVFASIPDMIFKSYIPDFTHSYKIMYILQKLQFSFSGFLTFGIDAFYIALFVNIKLEYQKLVEDLELLQASENKRESLKLWIKQHIFLTDYTKRFAATFSEASFLQYIAAIINLCIEAYLLSQTKTGGLFNIVYIIEIFCQISLICLTADEITNRAIDLADALFSIQWYDFPHKDMKILPLLIQQAQMPIQFVAGGLVNIDKPAIKSILQNAYGFYTLVRQINQN